MRAYSDAHCGSESRRTSVGDSGEDPGPERLSNLPRATIRQVVDLEFEPRTQDFKICGRLSSWCSAGRLHPAPTDALKPAHPGDGRRGEGTVDVVGREAALGAHGWRNGGRGGAQRAPGAVLGAKMRKNPNSDWGRGHGGEKNKSVGWGLAGQRAWVRGVSCLRA